MKFMVVQQLGPDDDVTTEHLQPLARVVADSMLDQPTGEVIWLSGSGTVDTKRYYMLFEAPDLDTMRQCLTPLSGVQSVERVMSADKHTMARGLLLGMAKDYEERAGRN